MLLQSLFKLKEMLWCEMKGCGRKVVGTLEMEDDLTIAIGQIDRHGHLWTTYSNLPTFFIDADERETSADQDKIQGCFSQR